MAKSINELVTLINDSEGWSISNIGQTKYGWLAMAQKLTDKEIASGNRPAPLPRTPENGPAASWEGTERPWAAGDGPTILDALTALHGAIKIVRDKASPVKRVEAALMQALENNRIARLALSLPGKMVVTGPITEAEIPF